MKPLVPEPVRRMAKHLCIPVRQHHVIVHADGRVYFCRRANMPTTGHWHISTLKWYRKTGMPILTVSPVKEGRQVGIPLTRSRVGTDLLNFRCKRMSDRLVPPGKENIRLRIYHRTLTAPDGTFRIYLSPIPVRDICSIWQDMTDKTHEHDTLADKRSPATSEATLQLITKKTLCPWKG